MCQSQSINLVWALLFLLLHLATSYVRSWSPDMLHTLRLSSHSRRSCTRIWAKVKAPKESFFCSECGVEHIRWMGKCTSCESWNTITQMRQPKLSHLPLDPRSIVAGTVRGGVQKGSPSGGSWLPQTSLSGDIIAMKSVDISKAARRLELHSGEFNRVLGGGLVKGSTVLLTGEPGIGKSTILLQLAHNIASEGMGSVVYISGEENPQQIASRAARLKLNTDGIFLLCDVETESAVRSIVDMGAPGATGAEDSSSHPNRSTNNSIASNTLPTLIIVDSVQTMQSVTSTSTGGIGSVGQIRDSTAQFVQLAKATGSVVLLVGHVTKSGEVAGPRTLEHMVDTVLYLEGTEHSEHRLLRGVKNRYGSTAEVGVFEMTETGLEDVHNPSELFLSSALIGGADEDGDGGSGEGSCVAVLMEGTRPLLAEIQCLVNGRTAPQLASKYKNKEEYGGDGDDSGENKDPQQQRFVPINPKRAADGFPLQRLLLICAVIEKRLQLPLWSKDIYLNVVGGLRVSEPSADLAVAMSIVSSALEESIIPGTAFIGEIGLGGELRGGKRVEDRVREAVKMGFTRIVVPSSAGFKRKAVSSSGDPVARHDDQLFECKTIYDALLVAFANPKVASSLSRQRCNSRNRNTDATVKYANKRRF